MSFVKARFNNFDSGFSVLNDIDSISLSPAEEFTLSRARAAGDGIRLADLSTNGLAEEESLRSVYALTLSGVLYSPHWRTAISANAPVKPKKRSAPPAAPEAPPVVEADTTEADVEALFTRLSAAKNHYDVLGVPKGSSTAQIKDAYHTLARRFHPDRFHQSSPELRTRIESAFARMAQAYEVLSDTKQRDTYDQAGTTRRTRKSPAGAKAPRDANAKDQNHPDSRAETCFRMGTEALDRNQIDQAIRLLAEAAMLEPREARYHAHYGSALMRRPGSRRTAETELQAALAIEPDNASFRVMLAELYQQLGLRRRAEGEVARALAADPANQAARALLSILKSK
jgi:curved DNA-binding protein CbpA